MSEIKRGNIRMKPRWVFVAGSLAMIAGISSLVIIAVLSLNLFIFSLRTHGPLSNLRYQQIISDFPWWAILISIIGITAGFRLLKKCDFSYKKNLGWILTVSLIIIILAPILINQTGINDAWGRKSHMRRIFDRYDGRRMQMHRQNWINRNF